LGFDQEACIENKVKFERQIEDEKELQKTEQERVLAEKRLTRKTIWSVRRKKWFRYFLYLWSIGAITGTAFRLF
jgi:hypothetical protein